MFVPISNGWDFKLTAIDHLNSERIWNSSRDCTTVFSRLEEENNVVDEAENGDDDHQVEEELPQSDQPVRNSQLQWRSGLRFNNLYNHSFLY